MSRAAAFADLESYLDANLTDATVTRVANDPRRHFDKIIKASWPDQDNDLIAIYAAPSAIGNVESGGRFRRLQEAMIMVATADQSQSVNAAKIDARVDQMDALLRKGTPGAPANKTDKTEPLSEAVPPLAAELYYVQLNYCGGE